MNNTLGHSLLQQALCCPSVIENQGRTSPGFSGSLLNRVAGNAKNRRRKTLLSNRFLENNLSAAEAKSLPGNYKGRSMVTRAVLATDPSSELAGKFNLDSNSELQVSIQAPVLGSLMQVDFLVTNSKGSLVLHWGALRQRKKDWNLPSRRPNGTEVYKNRALRTPFVKTGLESTLKIEIDDPEIQAIEFLIVDEGQNRWFKNNGKNFQVKLPEKRQQNPNVSVAENCNASLPEDLVQINAYIRWERKGRQAYTPDQEKEEYEAARTELLDEISRGTSIEELRAKLTKNPDDAKVNDTKKSLLTASDIPEDLVQVQSYIRWERAGKPQYSPEKQLMEFEEAREELQHELEKGSSLTELRQKLTKGKIQTKVHKQLETKKKISSARIQRKKRDIMKFLNKYEPEVVEQKVPHLPIALTAVEVYSKTLEEQDLGPVLNKKVFGLGEREVLVLVTKAGSKTKVYLATDQKGPLILHWALSERPGEWKVPPCTLPPNSVLLEKACETPFVEASAKDLVFQAVEIEIDEGEFKGMSFVLRVDETWIKNSGSDFYVEFGTGSTKRKKDAGDGKGTDKALLDKIASVENEAQKSFMHRFNIAADLTEQAKDGGKLGLSGILVWMRFMATRQLVWNKNYNVKPREISKAQDRLTNLLQDAYRSYPHY